MSVNLRVIVVVALLGGGVARAETVRHVPPAPGDAGTAIELVVEASATTPTLTARYRTTGTAAFSTIELVKRDDERWVAVVPAVAVAAPGIDYFLVAGGQPVFASEQWPHTLPVHVTAENQRIARDLIRSGGRRYRIGTAFEWVDYGSRTIGADNFKDRYYRIDADLGYRLWVYPLEELRVGYTRLFGDTTSMDVMKCGGVAGSTCQVDAGFKVGGWFELGIAPVEGFRLDARAMVLANADGFGVGGRLEARLGEREGSHIALGLEGMTDVGANGLFRIGWGTVPGLPMAATVEITRVPDTTAPTGVRLFYDIARAVGGGVRLGLRAGYAARNQDTAGFTTGANATVDF